MVFGDGGSDGGGAGWVGGCIREGKVGVGGRGERRGESARVCVCV